MEDTGGIGEDPVVNKKGVQNGTERQATPNHGLKGHCYFVYPSREVENHPVLKVISNQYSVSGLAGHSSTCPGLSSPVGARHFTVLSDVK